MLYADGLLRVLNEKYGDWRDVSKWPQVPGADNAYKKMAMKQSDPLSKNGVVGAFCRTYDIYGAMDTYCDCASIRLHRSVDQSAHSGNARFCAGELALVNRVGNIPSGYDSSVNHPALRCPSGVQARNALAALGSVVGGCVRIRLHEDNRSDFSKRCLHVRIGTRQAGDVQARQNLELSFNFSKFRPAYGCALRVRPAIDRVAKWRSVRVVTSMSMYHQTLGRDVYGGSHF